MRCLLCVALFWSGCILSNDARYCDASRPCADPSFPNCDEVKHECESGGLPDAGSGDDAAVAPPDLAVIACTDSSTCPPSAPVCSPSGACVQCVGNMDCFGTSTTPFCGPANTCVACVSSDQCTPLVCDGAGNFCRACRAHAECPSGVCDVAGGSCIDPSQILLVDNGGRSVAACSAARPTRNGQTPATAFCDISESEAFAGRPYVLVSGHGAGFPYGPISIMNARSYVGPGYKAATPAVIAGTPAGAGIVTMSNLAHVVIDGFEIDGGNAKDGIDCSSTKSTAPHNLLVVRNSYIHNTSGSAGIFPVGCDLVVDSSRVSTASIRDVDDTGSTFVTSTTLTNSQFDSATADGLDFNGVLTMDSCLVINNSGGNGNGLQLNNPTFTVTNSFFYNNDQAVNFNLTGTASSIFLFNTVAFNTHGFACGQNTIQASIYVHNGDGPLVGGTGPGTCKTIDVVTDSAGAPQPVFVNTASVTTYDFRLATDTPAHLSVNQACCIDVVKGPLDGGSAPLPDHDFFGDHRPLGAGWDVGAHEAR